MYTYVYDECECEYPYRYLRQDHTRSRSGLISTRTLEQDDGVGCLLFTVNFVYRWMMNDALDFFFSPRTEKQ